MRASRATLFVGTVLLTLACGGYPTGDSGKEAPGDADLEQGSSPAGSLSGYGEWDWSIWTFTDGDWYAFTDDGEVSKSFGSPRKGTWQKSASGIQVRFGDETSEVIVLGPCAATQPHSKGVYRIRRTFPHCVPDQHDYRELPWSLFRVTDGDTISFTEGSAVARSWGSGRSGTWSEGANGPSLTFGANRYDSVQLDTCHLVVRHPEGVWRTARTFPGCGQHLNTYQELDWTIWTFLDGDTYSFGENGAVRRSWGSKRDGTWTATAEGYTVTFGDYQATVTSLDRCAMAQEDSKGEVLRAYRTFPKMGCP